MQTTVLGGLVDAETIVGAAARRLLKWPREWLQKLGQQFGNLMPEADNDWDTTVKYKWLWRASSISTY